MPVPRRERHRSDQPSFDYNEDIESNSYSTKSRSYTMDSENQSLNEFRDEPRRSPHKSQTKQKKKKKKPREEEQAVPFSAEEPRTFSWYRWLVNGSICVCVLLTLVIVIIAVMYLTDDDKPRGLATCNGCHCIVDSSNGYAAPCPETMPETEFSLDMIETLMAQKCLNPFPSTSCNPFDSGCDTSAVLPVGNEAVCGLHYMDVYCTEYKMQTYADRNTAQAAGGFVTHLGACGVCSTTQDLTVLMSHHDLDTVSRRCAEKGFTSKNKAKECFLQLGFTEPCASLYTDSSVHSEKNCVVTCALNDLQDTPFNEGATCALNDCMSCKEDNTAATFSKIAGRTRRTSGLLSAVARPCSEIASIQHLVCPSTKPLK